MWTLTYFAAFSFKWNHTFCPKQRRFIHCLKKKKPETGPFWSAPSSSSPGRVEKREKKIFFSPLFRTDFPPSDDFKKTPTWPTFHDLKGRWRGGSTVAAPATSPSLVFAYKNRGRGRKKEREEDKKKAERKLNEREQNKEKRKERGGQKKKQRREQKNRREREREEKQHRRPPRTTSAAAYRLQ